jgi:mono/diheme cytochrome c family protein
MGGVVLVLAGVLALCACSGGEDRPQTAAERGHQVYRKICTACHHVDPTWPGAQGPAIAGSSRELVEARVVRGEYPRGYTPKRNTALMPAFPNLAEHVDDLAAFLAEAGEPKPSS